VEPREESARAAHIVDKRIAAFARPGKALRRRRSSTGSA
jgi:hypothetical protein